MIACCFKLGAHRRQRPLHPGSHHPCPTGSARPTAQGRSEDLAVTRLCAPWAFKAKMLHAGICLDSVTFLTFRTVEPQAVMFALHSAMQRCCSVGWDAAN